MSEGEAKPTRERLERLGPVRDVPRVASGSPKTLTLEAAGRREEVGTVSVALALAKRGLSLLEAKRAVEALVRDGSIVVRLPLVDDWAGLIQDLEASGCRPSAPPAFSR